MFKVRDDEPQYAFVPRVDVPEQNRWGKDIQTADESSPLRGKSLNINNDTSVGENPNRYKQHGFHFTADNCIGCHACEAACSEKNDLPPHLSFRSVGYVEGGTYPAYRRLNISMACNHCDNPVCLKGCPTRAYTKYVEYGAVLQDPDICFGCGYCTWVCPYNAPQLDPIKGQVSKCNMCVDRLEVGLKPACAAACLGGALDFGIIESRPENRDQIKEMIPGFPTPDITHPNIRFQQTRTLPRELTRPDSMPIKYMRDDNNGGQYKAKARNELLKLPIKWNLKKLRSREDPLVIFTLITQAVIGAFGIMMVAPWFGFVDFSARFPTAYNGLLFAMLALETYGLVVSTMHLGKPHRFYRAFNNLRYSPVSREVAAVAVFFNGLGTYAVLHAFPGMLSWLLPTSWVEGLAATAAWVALLAGPLAIYAMHKIYRIKARPYWNHWQVLTSFYGSALGLGGIVAGLAYAVSMHFTTTVTASDSRMMALLGGIAAAGLLVELIGLFAHSRYLKHAGGEAIAAHVEQTSSFGKSYWARNIGMATSMLACVSLAGLASVNIVPVSAWFAVSVLMVVCAVVGRALFYVMVIPTTMPGAFFWKNKGFQEHARETGLASMPQVGVVPNLH